MKSVEIGRQRVKIFLNILVLALAFYGVSRRDAAYQQTSSFENLMIDVIAPMQRSIAFLQDQVTSFFENYVANVSASKENDQLKGQILELQNRIFFLEELDRENKRLKSLLQFGELVAQKKVLAQIVAWDASSDFRVLRINKGSSDGIRLQSTVVTAEGLVGYVYRLTNHFADILTILDPNNRVDAIVQRVRSHGIIEGHSYGKCIMKYVTRTKPVILGDTVLTSGLGNIYPKGIKIGTVSRIERESYGMTQHIELNPSVDFGRLEEVVVLVSEGDQTYKKEWEALDGPEEEK